MQSAEPAKRQPRSQCLSTLVRPVFGEVRAGPGVLWGGAGQPHPIPGVPLARGAQCCLICGPGILSRVRDGWDKLL